MFENLNPVFIGGTKLKLNQVSVIKVKSWLKVALPKNESVEVLNLAKTTPRNPNFKMTAIY